MEIKGLNGLKLTAKEAYRVSEVSYQEIQEEREQFKLLSDEDKVFYKLRESAQLGYTQEYFSSRSGEGKFILNNKTLLRGLGYDLSIFKGSGTFDDIRISWGED